LLLLLVWHLYCSILKSLSNKCIEIRPITNSQVKGYQQPTTKTIVNVISDALGRHTWGVNLLQASLTTKRPRLSILHAVGKRIKSRSEQHIYLQTQNKKKTLWLIMDILTCALIAGRSSRPIAKAK